MYTSLKRLLVGSPLHSERATHERLPKKTALPIFASDALSSVAYSTEAVLLVLLAAGSAALGYLVPIVFCLVGLLAILTLSYRQTIHAYPSGGGAYVVAKDNLGTTPGLVAGASLLVDYILTVAVSVSAGVAAITSAAQGTRLEFLEHHRVALGVALVALIAVINLRGVRESGAIFAGPTYAFIFAMLLLIACGFVRHHLTGSTMDAPDDVHFDATVGSHDLTTLTAVGLAWFISRAFSAGCTALTGVEAISNGVQSFERPEAKNASATLVWMAAIMTALIVGTGLLAYTLHAHPAGHGGETLVSMMARHTFGTGPTYFFIQAATAAILVLAANTAFAGFPSLASLIAADRYLPRQLANRGDRLVFSNGIVILAVLASALVAVFNAREQALLPLYAVGVFLSFTLSQAGMVVHWLRERQADDARERIRRDAARERVHLTEDPTRHVSEHDRLQAIERDEGGNWLLAAAVNGAGAVITSVVLVVIATTKFTQGAWAVLVLVPLIVLLFRAINGHYRLIAAQLSLEKAGPLPPMRHRVIVPVSGIHRGVLPALQYARSIAGGGAAGVDAVYVEVNPQNTEEMRREWEKWGGGVSLKVIESPFRSVTAPLLRYIDGEAREHRDSITTVVLPEFVPRAWWQQLLHNQTALLIKGKLLFHPNVVVTSVPHHLRR